MKTIFTSCALLASFIIAAGDFTLNFSKGKWEESAWTSVTVLPSKKNEQAQFVSKPVEFTQKDDCVSVSFSPEQLKAGGDNALIIIDTKNPQGEFEVSFTIGKEKGTAPGICISPTYGEDKVLESCYAVFVADYTMAVWYAEVDRATGTMKYTHLARLSRWQDPDKKHTIRCRYEKTSFSLKVDDSDIVLFNYAKGFIPNSKIGIWGCHGTCEFYALDVKSKGTLPLSGVKP
jgi:hypothetical protein